MQPLIIDLSNKTVVIAGGGRIAARKAKVLLEQQANITFVAPDFSDEVVKIAQQHSYILLKKEIELHDFHDAFLCILATNDYQVNKAFGEELSPYKLVCVVDELTHGNTIFPATVTRGHLQIAVSSNGSSPKLTRTLKKQLADEYDESWTKYTAFLLHYRQLVKQLPFTREEKDNYLQEVLSDDIRLSIARQQACLESLQAAAVRSTEGKI